MRRFWILLVLAALAAPVLARADGRTDYNAHCAGCHGASGIVPTEKARALKADARTLSLKGSSIGRKEIIAVVENGRDGMPSFKGRMTREQIEGIVDYVLALRGQR